MSLTCCTEGIAVAALLFDPVDDVVDDEDANGFFNNVVEALLAAVGLPLLPPLPVVATGGGVNKTGCGRETARHCDTVCTKHATNRSALSNSAGGNTPNNSKPAWG